MDAHCSGDPRRHISFGTRVCMMWLIVSVPLLLVLFSAALAHNQRAHAQATGTITGRVTASDGGNLGPLVVFAADIVNNANRGETTLDATGHYTITGLPPASYRVEFNADDEGPYLAEYYNDTPNFGDLDPVPVTAGSTTSGIDAVLQRGGVITGQVVDAGTGLPVAGINVRTLGVVPGHSTHTDASGHYSLIALRSGAYFVCFATEFNENDLYLPECFDNKSTALGAERTPISVTEGMTTTNINAELLLGGMITGRVTDELSGEPLAGVRARAIGSGGSETADTDAAGFYTITALVTDTYIVAFSGGTNFSDEYYDNKTSEEDADPIAVTPGVVVTGINGTLASVVSITGRVVIAGRTEPFSAVEVAAYNDAGDFIESSLSRPTGHYTLTTLPPGDYRIRFDEDKYANQYYDNSVIFEEATLVTVMTNAVTSGINATLIPRQSTDLIVATASTRPNAIIASRARHFGPIFTLDGGQQWQTFATLPLEPLRDPIQIALVPKDDPAQPLRFVLGSEHDSSTDVDGIFRSDDMGASWEEFEPLSDPRCDPATSHDISMLVASPADPQRVYGVTRCTKTRIVVEPIVDNYWTLYTSGDGGVTWERVNIPPGTETNIFFPLAALQPSPVTPARLYAHAKINLALGPWLHSDDYGQSWITDTYTMTALAWDWTDPAKLYGVEDSAIAEVRAIRANVFRYTGKRSTDNGATWSEWAQQPCRTSFLQLLALPPANTLLMLCDQGLFRSTNGGDSWSLLTAQTGGILTTHSGDHNVTLWMRGTELWISRDQGSTWTNLGVWHDMHLPSIVQP